MTLGILESIRHSFLTDISTAIDAGAAGGFLRVYDGVRPATGGAVTTQLAELQFSATSFQTPSGGSMSINAITPDTNTVAGTATWFRIVDSDSNFVCDGEVTATSGGGDLELNNVVIPAGVQLSIPTGSLTAGNP